MRKLVIFILQVDLTYMFSPFFFIFFVHSVITKLSTGKFQTFFLLFSFLPLSLYFVQLAQVHKFFTTTTEERERGKKISLSASGVQ